MKSVKFPSSPDPPLHRGASLLHRWPALVKFVLTVGIVLAVSLLPREHAAWLILPACILVPGIIVARLPLWPFIKRLLLLEPLVLGVALMALFTPASRGGGWPLFGFLVARSTLALVAMILFSAITPFTEMLQLFRRLHIPFLLVTTLALMHRYLFVLADESARMRRARQSRTFSRRRGMEWKTASTVIAQLFLRASTRADRIYDAMTARGWGASPPPPRLP